MKAGNREAGKDIHDGSLLSQGSRLRLGSSPAPLLKVSVNISAQWLIGRFVRVSHSKSDLINCAGVGIRTLLLIVEFFPTPTHQCSLQRIILIFEECQTVILENDLYTNLLSAFFVNF
ncbi:TPA: hypothetical protein ACGO24_000792 [Streptococcus suis]